MTFFCLASTNGAAAQSDSTGYWIAFSGGMGISAFSGPSVVDYVNLVAQPAYAQQLGEFTSVTEFFASAEAKIVPSWAAGLDYDYVIKSYSVNGGGGTSQFTYSFHAPGAVVHYLIEGRGYELRFGGGVSYVRATFSEALYGNPTFTDYTADGASVKAEAIGNTMFDEHFYGTIAADLRWITGGAFSNSQRKAEFGSRRVELGAFMAGIKFGVMVRW